MSIHSSLRGADGLIGDRSVFKRMERINILKKEGRFDDEGSVFGLPKVRTKFKVAKKKKEAPKEEAAEGAEAAGEEASAESGKKG